MRVLALLALLATPLLGRAGPDTASRVALLDTGCSMALRVEPRACPPPVIAELTIDLPSPGHEPGTPTVDVDHEARRIRIGVRALPKPGDGMWPAVMTPATVSVAVGTLETGRWIVEVHYAVGGDRPLQPHAVFLLDAS